MIFQLEEKIGIFLTFGQYREQVITFNIFKLFLVMRWEGVIFFCKYPCKSYTFSVHINKQFKLLIIHK